MLFEKQQYQQDCVDNIVAALEGVDLRAVDTEYLVKNIKHLDGAGTGAMSIYPVVPQPRLDVLMETGTGKTFAYLQTILELHQRFEQKKFIIVLPRTAIKQGVIQNIQLTDEYFYNLYGQHIRYIDYPGKDLNAVHYDFIASNDLCVLITTNSAFNSQDNRINRKTESLIRFDSAWDGIAAQKPVIIIDEPHLLKGTETKRGLDRLGDCLRLRFGATYPKDEDGQLSNLVYALDSINAFNQYLVKQIGVNTLYTHAEESGLAVRRTEPRSKFCEVEYQINEQPHKSKIRVGDDLGAKTGLRQYNGDSITRITQGKVALSNGETLLAQSGNYQLSEVELKQMIRHAIQMHFDKEEYLFEQGIKALALFFIPGINDFRGDNPLIKRLFEEEYSTLRKQYYDNTDNENYRQYLDRDFEDGELCVHNGYFSGDKGTKEQREREGVRLILSDKERLLSLDEPLRFIFSVWALQEGWDNPNVFTICKLAYTGQETSCRQQVGRGLRIAVNQAGKRLTHKYLEEDVEKFYRINALDMVVSQQEHGFIHSIQREVEEASLSVVGDEIDNEILMEKGFNQKEANHIIIALEEGGIIAHDAKRDIYTICSPILPFIESNPDKFGFLNNERLAFAKQVFAVNSKTHILDKNRRPKMLRVRENRWREFKNLWETINRQAEIVYAQINEDELIDSISAQFNDGNIRPTTSHVTKEKLDAQSNRASTIEDDPVGERIEQYFVRHGLPEFIHKLAAEECLPLHFLVRLFSKINRRYFDNDPKKASDLLVRLVKDEIHKSILHSINYRFTQTTIRANSLQDEDGNLIPELRCSLLGRFQDDDEPREEFLYDTVVYDSHIEKHSIQNDPVRINGDRITVFAKLPRINIPTPYKTYNPDFAYLIDKEDGKTLFLVVETKGHRHETDIPESERDKIEYAKKFFQSLQDVLDQDGTNVDIRYQTRINDQELSSIVRDCLDG